MKNLKWFITGVAMGGMISMYLFLDTQMSYMAILATLEGVAGVALGLWLADSKEPAKKSRK